jgi:hypothetical protein
LHNGIDNILLSIGIMQCQKPPRQDGAAAMLAQFKLDIAEDTQLMSARQLTLVRSNLWDQAAPVSAAWVEANPEKAMAYLMVAQSEDLLG